MQNQFQVTLTAHKQHRDVERWKERVAIQPLNPIKLPTIIITITTFVHKVQTVKKFLKNNKKDKEKIRKMKRKNVKTCYS